MALRPINGERRNAAVRTETALGQAEIPQAKNDLTARVPQMQAVIDAAVQALADMDVIIAGVDASSNAQLRTMVKDMARAMKGRVRDIKDLAQASKRTIRVVT